MISNVHRKPRRAELAGRPWRKREDCGYAGYRGRSWQLSVFDPMGAARDGPKQSSDLHLGQATIEPPKTQTAFDSHHRIAK